MNIFVIKIEREVKMRFNKKHAFILIALFLIGTSITCTFATDINSNGTDIGIPSSEQSISDTSNFNINIDTIEDTSVMEDVSISGALTDENSVPIRNSEVNIVAEGIAYGDNESTNYINTNVKTNHEGRYSFNYKPNTGGSLNITVSYHNDSASTSTYIIPKSTNVNTNCSKTITVGESFNLTGRLTDCEGNILRYTSVGVLLRGTAYGDKNYENFSKTYCRTDNDGFYSYMLTPEFAGRYDICVYYPGYHYYRFNRTDKSVLVYPHKTIVNVDDNNLDIYYGENISFTGTLTDGNGNPLRYTGVGVLTDNKTYIRTDVNGHFNYTYVPSEVGIKDLLFYYPGYHNYAYSDSSYISVNVHSKDPVVTINPIFSCHEGANVTVSGSFISDTGKPLGSRNVEIVMEYYDENDDGLRYNKTIETSTDSDGLFSTDDNEIFHNLAVGAYTINVICYENDFNNPCQESTFFYVNPTEDDIIITDIFQQDSFYKKDGLITLKGYVSVSDESRKYINSKDYSLKLVVIPEVKKFPDEKITFSPLSYTPPEEFTFVIAHEDLYTFKTNNVHLLHLSYELSNGMTINSSEIKLKTITTDNNTVIDEYSLFEHELILDVYNVNEDEYGYANSVDISGSILSSYDLTDKFVKLDIYNEKPDKSTNTPIKTIYPQLAEDGSFVYNFDKVELLKYSKKNVEQESLYIVGEYKQNNLKYDDNLVINYGIVDNNIKILSSQSY